MVPLMICVLVVLATSINGEYPGNIYGPRRTNDSIAVIGGGISAIHMAYLLKQRGFTKVHILVEEGRLGGDEVHSKTHRETNHEMGKYMFLPTIISQVNELMQKYRQGQLTEIPLPTVWEEDAQQKLVAKPLSVYLAGMAKQHWPDSSDEEIRRALIQKISEFNSTVLSLLSLLPNMNEVIPSEPSWPQKGKLKGSFKKFLTDNRLDSLLPLFTYLFSISGYGRPEDFAAYYGIYFFRPAVLNRLVSELKSNTGLKGFMINAQGMEKLLDAWAQGESMNVSKNVLIEEMKIGETRDVKHRIKMNIQGVKKTGEYDFIVFAECLKKYVKLNPGRSPREYQLFLRPTTRYIVKTLVDSLNVPRGDTPFDYYVDSFKSEGTTDYKVAYSIDSFATYNRYSGDTYKQNIFRNTNDPNDQNGKFKSAVYTQMSRNEPNVVEAHSKLLKFLREKGGTDMNIVETKIYRFFTNYMDRDLNNGMLYHILKMQGKKGVWYIGKGAYLDNVAAMLGYNTMIMNKYNMAQQ